jgi:hypothetical protein
MMLSVSHTVWWRMIGSLRNRQLEGNGSSCGLIWDTLLAFAWMDCGKLVFEPIILT